MNNTLLVLLLIAAIGAVYWVLKGEKFNRSILEK